MSRAVPLALAALLVFTGHAGAGETRVPVPATIIYPGDVVSDAMLVETTLPDALPPGAAATARAEIVGKVSRRTLLPGRPVPPGALETARLVTSGAAVRLVFDEAGLSIATVGQAMGPGGRGDLVRVRNTESGIVVTGTVQGDGSVKVGG